MAHRTMERFHRAMKPIDGVGMSEIWLAVFAAGFRDTRICWRCEQPNDSNPKCRQFR